MTVSKHNLSAYAAGTVLHVIEANITMDDTWSPYIQASFTTPFTAANAALLDPRTNNKVTIVVEQVFGNGAPISVWSGIYGGLTIAAITTNYTGKFIFQVSEPFYQPYNNFGARSATSRAFILNIRSRSINHAAATMTVELASDEALLQDFALVSKKNYDIVSLDVRTIVNAVLGEIGAVLAIDASATGTVEDGAQLWEPGQTGWDYLAPLVQAAGLALFCDEDSVWHLVGDDYIAPGSTNLDYTNTLTDATESISRDQNDWYDSVVIKYIWTDALGATQYAYDIAQGDTVTKTLYLEYQNQRYPKAGAAQRVLDRATGRGRVNDVVAVSDYETTPRQPATIDLLDTDTQTGFVSSVSFSFPADTMAVKTRGLVNTPPTAWAYQPVGLRWQDISAGVSWASYA